MSASYFRLTPLLFLIILGCTGAGQSSDAPSAAEALALFDGTSLDGWTMTGPGHFSLEPDGSMLSHGGMGLFYYSEQQFKDFDLELEWKVEKPNTNSGIFVRFPDAPDPWFAVNTGYEIQIDDSQPPDTQTGAVYSFSAPFKANAKPAGEWNHYRIVAAGQRYQVYLNGERVNDFIGSRSLAGYVGLQNHDDDSKAWFRNIRVKPLPTTTDAPASLADLFTVDGDVEPINVLMVTATHGFRHGPAIDTAKVVMAALSQTTELRVEVTEDLEDLNDANLARYDLLFFANSTLRVPAEEAATTNTAAAVTMEGSFNNYDFVLSIPDGDLTGQLALSGTADALTGAIEFDRFPGASPITDPILDGDVLTFLWNAGPMGTFEASLTLTADGFDGTLAVQGSPVPMKGTATGPAASASTAATPTDAWNITLKTPQGDMEGTMAINSQTLTGTIAFSTGTTALDDLSIDGDALAFTFDGGEQFGTISGTGTTEGETISGTLTAGQFEVPYAGRRQATPAEGEEEGPRVTEAQREAILNFVRSGKGIVGAHAALDAFYGWDTYREMVGGGLFKEHPWTQSVRVVIEEPDNPSVSHFGEGFWLRDEIYVLDQNPRWNSRVLASLDMESVGVSPGPADPSRSDFPISWIRTYEGGKVFMTKLGHFPDIWTTPAFLEHLLKGMRMAAGRIPADFSGHRVKEVIAENVWPDDIAVDDRNNVWIAELRGKVHHYDATTGQTRLIAELPTTDPTKIEHGLFGIEIDPNFYDGEPYVYLYYTERETFINTLSRFAYRDGMIDLSSEHVLLRVPTEPQCCHQAGDIEWGPDGTLYLSTGDTGMSETRPDWEVPEERLEAFKQKHGLKDLHWSRLVDSERSAQNLQDMRGKILRINKDGTIPKDNPFFGQPGVRWEIYAYGLRNPYRFKVDPETNALYIGVVGPDASYDYDEYDVSTTGGENFGWPRTLGRLFFNEWTPEQIPGYVPPMWEYTYETGGRSATVGPIYRSQGTAAFPTVFQNKVFVYDWSRRWIKYGEVVEDRFVNDQQGDVRHTPLQVDLPALRLKNIKEFDQLTDTAPISMEMGPDGSLYVAEFDGFWDAGPNARVTRYRWVSHDATRVGEARDD